MNLIRVHSYSLEFVRLLMALIAHSASQSCVQLIRFVAAQQLFKEVWKTKAKESGSYRHRAGKNKLQLQPTHFLLM